MAQDHQPLSAALLRLADQFASAATLYDVNCLVIYANLERRSHIYGPRMHWLVDISGIGRPLLDPIYVKVMTDEGPKFRGIYFGGETDAKAKRFIEQSFRNAGRALKGMKDNPLIPDECREKIEVLEGSAKRSDPFLRWTLLLHHLAQTTDDWVFHADRIYWDDRNNLANCGGDHVVRPTPDQVEEADADNIAWYLADEWKDGARPSTKAEDPAFFTVWLSDCLSASADAIHLLTNPPKKKRTRRRKQHRDTLSQRQAEALMLYQKGFSYEQIGEELGNITKQSAKGLVDRGLERLSKMNPDAHTQLMEQRRLIEEAQKQTQRPKKLRKDGEEDHSAVNPLDAAIESEESTRER